MSKKTVLWVLLCLGSAAAGYWTNEWLNQRVAKANFIRSLSWAIDAGILTVDEDRLTEIETHKNDDPTDSVDSAASASLGEPHVLRPHTVQPPVP